MKLTNADKANAQEPTRQTTLKWRQLTRPVSPAQYRLLPSATEYSWHNLTHRSKSHSANEQCWKKQKTGLLIRLTLCSALVCLHIQLGISQAGTENAAQFVFFVFPQIGPLCSHKSTNSSYPNSLLVWPVSCVSVSWSKRQGERDGEENQTRYHSDVSYHSSRHRLFFLASSSQLSMHSLWRLCSEQHCDCNIPNHHTAGSAQSQRTGMFLYWKLFWKSQVKTSLS